MYHRSLEILLLFAGNGAAEHALMHQLRRLGHRVTAIDKKLLGGAGDVLRRSIGDALLRRIAAGAFDVVWLAPPCRGFSVRHEPPLTSAARPRGVWPCPAGWEAYLGEHNRLVDFAVAAMEACVASRTPFGCENPADRSDADSPAYWPQHAARGCLWQVPEVDAVLRRARATAFTFAQCAAAIGGRAQKWTTIAASPGLAQFLETLASCTCPHGLDAHEEQLSGRAADGTSRTAAAAAYPRGLNDILAPALAAAGAERDPRRPTSAGGEPAASGIACGFELGAATSAACEAARHLAPAFSSVRNTVPAPAAELRREPLPGDLHAPMAPSKPPPPSKSLRRKPLLAEAERGRNRSGAAAHPGVETDLEYSARLAAVRLDAYAELFPEGGPMPDDYGIEYRDIFYPESLAEIEAWFRLADEAAAAIRRGEVPPPVPTRYFGQEHLRPFARGVVFDCRRPRDCRPVRRSDGSTPQRGRRLDRVALREIAGLLQWGDTDLLDQVCGGGVETRSDCEHVTVLAFHHPSLVQEVEMAAKDVKAGIAEEWVEAPTRELPFVPCRLQPRGVVLQSRARLRPDGTLEEYWKPRITTDNSFGGADSVNAGVPAGERAVGLPSAQDFGRGWAICQSAFHGASAADGGGTPVYGYCVDAESAYRFCPVQEADLWQQCFAFWDDSGSVGVAVDRRLGFGGAFAPNRYERVSRLVAAYAQHLQAEFDAAQPLPPCCARWAADREALQARGELPPGPAQLSPRYMQAFIDDHLGSAAGDRVTPPPEAAHIVIDPAVVAAAGGRPAPPDSRAYVHAQLAVLALQRAGLSAAPGKVAVGAQVVGLGLLFDGDRGTIGCPQGKREAISGACRAMLEAAESTARVDRPSARRLVGRLGNLSQVAPELSAILPGGYAVSEAAWEAGGRARRSDPVQLKHGSPAYIAWTALLREAPELLVERGEVAMAPLSIFPSRRAAGAITCVTDASGEDGWGGYAFRAEEPGRVYVAAVWWPADIRAALAASADPEQASLREARDQRAAPYLPMPAAELFAATALARAMGRRHCVRTAFSVGDCAPAVAVINAAHSGNPAMRALLHSAAPAVQHWLAAHVRRELNSDADVLSHPERVAEVIAAAEAAGLKVEMLDGPEMDDWAPLRQAIVEGRAARRRRKRRRGGGRPAGH